MISEFMVAMMASAEGAARPDSPVSPSLSTYSGSLVRVSWTNANGGALPTRVYRQPHSGGAWTLRNTVAAGLSSYDTGDNVSNAYNYSVEHYDAGTGLASPMVPAASLPPSAPTGVSTSLYSGSKIQVNFASSAYYTRGYKSVGGVWELQTTLEPGATNWGTAAFSGSFAVSHYDAVTGLESEMVEAGGA